MLFLFQKILCICNIKKKDILSKVFDNKEEKKMSTMSAPKSPILYVVTDPVYQDVKNCMVFQAFEKTKRSFKKSICVVALERTPTIPKEIKHLPCLVLSSRSKCSYIHGQDLLSLFHKERKKTKGDNHHHHHTRRITKDLRLNATIEDKNGENKSFSTLATTSTSSSNSSDSSSNSSDSSSTNNTSSDEEDGCQDDTKRYIDKENSYKQRLNHKKKHIDLFKHKNKNNNNNCSDEDKKIRQYKHKHKHNNGSHQYDNSILNITEPNYNHSNHDNHVRHGNHIHHSNSDSDSDSDSDSENCHGHEQHSYYGDNTRTHPVKMDFPGNRARASFYRHRKSHVVHRHDFSPMPKSHVKNMSHDHHHHHGVIDTTFDLPFINKVMQDIQENEFRICSCKNDACM